MNAQSFLTSTAIAYTLFVIAVVLFAFVVLKTNPQRKARRK